jgi:hypothetical protein
LFIDVYEFVMHSVEPRPMGAVYWDFVEPRPMGAVYWDFVEPRPMGAVDWDFVEPRPMDFELKCKIVSFLVIQEKII